ncbi:MAG TPA: CopG family transcriptional regulator [Candidatus Limnocylindrales bacterium]|nr:CopG family transcriptional regulator [Candidatus Limnocylindrales bacterium]
MTAQAVDALAQHDFGRTDLACRRCGTSYRRVVEESPACHPYRPGSHAPQRMLPPTVELMRLRNEGVTLQEIGTQFGVSRQAVDQALHRRPGGLPTRQARADSEYVDPRRPHLSWIRVTCEPELRYELVIAAQRENVSLSEIVRRACRRYVGQPE